MGDRENIKNTYPRNSSASTPAQLLASVLEQRYAHKSSPKIKEKNEKPDPMTFPAMQKALGEMYSTIVEIVDEETALQENIEDEKEQTEDSIQVVNGLNEQLLNMVSEIEQNDKEREIQKNAITVEVKKKKDDPYNRAVNYYSEPVKEPDNIDLSNDLEIETIISDSRRKNNR